MDGYTSIDVAPHGGTLLTPAILAAGLALVVATALAMRRPPWRLPALAFAILAIPGNVDNLVPQMVLDPNQLANNTAPVVSFVDVLIAWGVLLSRGQIGAALGDRTQRWVIGGAVAFWALTTVVTAVNLIQGAPIDGSARSIVHFARVPALLAIGFGVAAHIGDGRRLAVAITVGVLSLLANGIYTSTATDASRFTAATFGRNGFSLALMIGAVVAAGLAIGMVRARNGPGPLAASLPAALAIAGVYGAIATGTRMSILAALPVTGLALLVNRSWMSRRGVTTITAIVVVVVAVGLAAVTWSPEGERAISAITDPGETVDIVTNPDEQPWYSPVRSRSHWWGQARAMGRADPLTGVGAWQWNHVRYDLERDAVRVVADPHNTYLQLASEYGVLVVAAYATLLAAVLLTGAAGVVKGYSPVVSSWPATMLAAAAILGPLTEMTNSHFFNVRLGALIWLLLATFVAIGTNRTTQAVHRSQREHGSN